MKRTISICLILAVLLSCACLLTGCTEEQDTEYPVTVNGVVIDSEPKSVVVLDSAIADLISYIGYDRKLVGRSMNCDQEFLSFALSVGSADSPAVDTILSLNADLVILDQTTNESVRSELNANGVKTIVFDHATDLNTLRSLYRTVGAVLGGNITGARKGSNAYDELSGVMDRNKSAADIAKTAVYLYLDDDGQLCTFVKDSFEQKLFSFNGTINVLVNQAEPAVVSTELRLGSPSCIFYDSDAAINYLLKDEKLRNLPALRENNICRISLKSFYRLGTSYHQALYQMAAFLNGEKEATLDEATPDEMLLTDDDAYDDYDSDYDSGYDSEYDDYAEDEIEDVYDDSED